MSDLHSRIIDWCDARDAEHATTGCPGGPDCLHAAVAVVRAVAATHRPYPIYDECGCLKHTDDDIAAGRAVETEYGRMCVDHYAYNTCRECCLHSDNNVTWECDHEHDHREGEPMCATQRAIAIQLGLTAVTA